MTWDIFSHAVFKRISHLKYFILQFYHSMLSRISYCLLITFIISGCQPNTTSNTKTSDNLSFESVKGITFYEVRRAFENGLSFNDLGFQQEPEWILKFIANDSVAVYSPLKNKMLPFSIHHDHDNYYRFAQEWFRVNLVSKDSLVFQRLEVKSLKVKNDERSNVYMTFYADDYIKNKLKTTVEQLKRPLATDTAFIRKKATAANLHPLDSNYFFAARNPVQFISVNELLIVEKVSNQDKLLNQSKSYDYLYPEYNIIINKAYKDFSYSFSAIVDTAGKIYVYDFPVFDEDLKAGRKRLLQGIVDVYLLNMMQIVPGETLNIPHASLIYISIKGFKK